MIHEYMGAVQERRVELLGRQQWVVSRRVRRNGKIGMAILGCMAIETVLVMLLLRGLGAL